MSRPTDKNEEAVRCADQFVYDEKTTESFISAQRAPMSPDGAEKIAVFLSWMLNMLKQKSLISADFYGL